MAKRPKLSAIHRRILAVLKEHPKGISEGDIRARLDIPSERQVQFGRRRRDLHYYYRIDKRQVGQTVLYIYRGPLAEPRDASPISVKVRAEILNTARGRCGMCGRTIEAHGITLVMDHKIPREWGGQTERDNLWAICEQCNHGKKNFFASVDSPAIRQAISHQSVHVRVGELLKAFCGVPVPSYLIGFVAGQDDWKKRTRELRYLGWKIAASKKKVEGRVRSFYTLRKYTSWPMDPTGWIRRYEQARNANDREFQALKREAAALRPKRCRP